MAFAPDIEDYDLNVLVALGGQEKDLFKYNYIKNIIIKKIVDIGYNLRFLCFNFMNNQGILKEAYAEVIIRRFKYSNENINNVLLEEIIKYVSLDTLVYFGMESDNEEVVSKCSDEFWLRAVEIEDKNEMIKKMRVKKKYKIKKKGDLK